jgi:hypothetical protein
LCRLVGWPVLISPSATLFLFYFTVREILRLNNNPIGSTLPAALGAMTSLIEIDFSSSQLSGEIPASYVSSPSLQRLFLKDNNLSGTIAPSQTAPLDLIEVQLQDNQISGTIPAEIGSWVSLGMLMVCVDFY